MKRRVVASNESYSSDEGIENNLIEELNEDEQELVSPRKRLRSNTQPEEHHKDASLSEDEIYYDDGDVDMSSILSGKFKPDPFGRRASGDINREQKPAKREDGPQTRSRRTKRFDSHLQSLKNNDLPEKMGTKYSRLKRGSEEKSDEDDIANVLSSVEEDENEQHEEDYGEYSSSESDGSYEPNNEEKVNDEAQDIDVSDEEMHDGSELQDNDMPKESDQSDFDDLTPVQRSKSRPATRSSGRLREEDDSNEEEEIKEDLSISGEDSVPFIKRSVRGKRKREILSDEEVDDEEPRATRRTKAKKPRIIEEELSQQESKSASEDEESDGVDKAAEENSQVNEGIIDDEDSIDLQSEAEEEQMYGVEEDDFESVPGDWRDFLDQLRKIEAMVEALRSDTQTKKRRVANKQYSGALEQLLYFTDHTNDMGQIFVSSVSHTTFLQRIARTWTVFLKEVGLRLEQNQIDSILRTFVRCHRRPYLKVASTMWKYLFKKKERVYPLNQDELLDICSPKTKLTVERQVQYLWLAKRLRDHEHDFESLMLCCAMGEFYKQRYPKKRTAQIEVWENELHQRFVTHMLTLAASPLRVINEMSLFNDACWKYVSIVASNPMAYMDLKLSEGVKRDFVSRFVLHYVIKYTRTQYFGSIQDKCEKLRRTIRTEFPFMAAFDCIVNPVFDNFVRLADNGCVWLQNIVLERLLLFNPGAARPTDIFKVLVYKRLWDIATSSVLSEPSKDRYLCKTMTNEIQDLTPLPVTARHMYIEVIERRIRHKEKLTGSTRAGIEAIGLVSMSMKMYLTAIGNAYEMIGHLKNILPAPADLRLLRYHLSSLDKDRDWSLIMNSVEDRCKSLEQRHEYLALRRETPFINTDANWIEKILARSEVTALNIED